MKARHTFPVRVALKALRERVGQDHQVGIRLATRKTKGGWEDPFFVVYLVTDDGETIELSSANATEPEEADESYYGGKRRWGLLGALVAADDRLDEAASEAARVNLLDALRPQDGGEA